MRRLVVLVFLVTACTAVTAPAGSMTLNSSAGTTPVPSPVPHSQLTPDATLMPIVSPTAAEPTVTLTPIPSATTRPTAASNPTQAVRQDLEVVEFGFTAFPGRNDDYVQYGVIIRNPNAASVSSFADVQISFFDASESLLTTDDELLATILPGQVTAIAGVAFDAGDASSMEVRVTGGDFEEIDFDTGELTYSDVSTRPGRFGGVRTTGRITSGFTGDQEDVQIIVIYRGASGDIVGGDITYVTVPSEGETSFEVEPLGDFDVEETEVYFQL